MLHLKKKKQTRLRAVDLIYNLITNLSTIAMVSAVAYAGIEIYKIHKQSLFQIETLNAFTKSQCPPAADQVIGRAENIRSLQQALEPVKKLPPKAHRK